MGGGGDLRAVHRPICFSLLCSLLLKIGYRPYRQVDEPKVELIGEMIQKKLGHLLGSNFWGLGDDFDSNSDEDLNNNVGYDGNGNKKYPLFNHQTDMRNR
ncbi:hypothetical protein GOBAR_AA31634 [Gossypium barbadense]|uniref:Uncharacterized protein n=1 Tax=Gossypium barbadense TaxID=3634 RepID=A0A2P5WD89_GOSBA|nr:hypothetical protein GOBAR_AA31634 [Gossypium barbadense]